LGIPQKMASVPAHHRFVANKFLHLSEPADFVVAVECPVSVLAVDGNATCNGTKRAEKNTGTSRQKAKRKTASAAHHRLMNLQQKTFAIFISIALVGSSCFLFTRLISASPVLSTALFLTLLGCSLAALSGFQLRQVSRIRKLLSEAKSLVQRNAFAERLRVKGTDELSALACSMNSAFEQAEKAQTRCQVLTEHLQQVFWIQNANTGVFEYVSPAFESIWGRARSTLTENPGSWLQLLHPEDREETKRKKLKQREGHPTDFYYRIVCNDGLTRWLWERSFPSFAPTGVRQRSRRCRKRGPISPLRPRLSPRSWRARPAAPMAQAGRRDSLERRRYWCNNRAQYIRRACSCWRAFPEFHRSTVGLRHPASACVRKNLPTGCRGRSHARAQF